MNQTPRTAALAAHGRSPANPARRRPRHISATAATLCATLALTGCLPRQEIAAPPSHPENARPQTPTLKLPARKAP